MRTFPFILASKALLHLVIADSPSNITSGVQLTSGQKRSLKLLLTNDDGWAEANIQAQYQILKQEGHFPIISAPTENQSGHGSMTKDVETLDDPAEYNSVASGAPGYGCEPQDAHICYVNGYPVDSVKYGIQNLSSIYFGGPPDFTLSGPNPISVSSQPKLVIWWNPNSTLYGGRPKEFRIVKGNIGPQAPFSGTFNAARHAAHEGIPAIATSVYGDKDRHSFHDLTPWDASYIYAKVVLRLVNVLTSVDKKAPYLPPLFVLNVNIQKAGPNENCKTPEDYKFVLTSQYGHSNWKFWKSRQDVKRCGRSALPSEHTIMDQEKGCWASITVRIAKDDTRANRDAQQTVVDLLGDFLTCPDKDDD